MIFRATARHADFRRSVERYRSGQTGQTVNLLAYAFEGSNPSLSTIFARKGLHNPTNHSPRQATGRNIPERIPGHRFRGRCPAREKATTTHSRTIAPSRQVNGGGRRPAWRRWIRNSEEPFPSCPKSFCTGQVPSWSMPARYGARGERNSTHSVAAFLRALDGSGLSAMRCVL